MISLIVEPRVVKTWNQFKRENPSFSIALDGYVESRPRFEPKGPYVNFDHHTEVDRLATRSTTGQVYLSVKQGLFHTFKKDGSVYANIFVNDADRDICGAVWLLQNSERYAGQKSGGPLVNKLFQLIDFFDTTGGTYPMDTISDLMRYSAWIFEPYSNARTNGKISKMEEPEMRNIIDDVGIRITDYVEGRGKQIPIDTNYDKIGGGNGWVMVIERGADARTGMFSDGINAFVSVRENSDKNWTYSLGKRSKYIPFPITTLYRRLNKIEGLSRKNGNHWGGSEIIGGSPRQTGSNLSPKELEKIINRCLIS